MGIFIPEHHEIEKLEDIQTFKRNDGKNCGKYFYNIELTAQKYICNMSVCKAADANEVWYIANNFDEAIAIREYKKDLRLKKCSKILKVVALI